MTKTTCQNDYSSLRVVGLSSAYAIVLLFFSVLTTESAFAEISTLKIITETSLGSEYFNGENEDYGVDATDMLRTEKYAKPTPVSIPGAKVISTGQLLTLIQSGEFPVILDVGPNKFDTSIPGASHMRNLGKAGSYDDDVQKRMEFILKQIMWAEPERPLVFLSGPKSNGMKLGWFGYNATLRAVRLGYTNVYWYRGGREAWKAAGLPVISLKPPHKR